MHFELPVSHNRVVPSLPTDKTIASSADSCSDFSLEVWPLPEPISLPELTSHMRSASSSPAAPIVFPSGAKARRTMPDRCPSNLDTSLKVDRFHTRIRPASSDEASKRPSREHVTQLPFAGPLTCQSSMPVSTSQSRQEASSLQENSFLPSGRMASDRTAAV